MTLHRHPTPWPMTNHADLTWHAMCAFARVRDWLRGGRA